jgi:peroxiredoxin
MKKYGAWGKKMMYGKSVEGTIRSTVVIGPDGAVLKHWPVVKNAEQHPREVVEFLQPANSVGRFAHRGKRRLRVWSCLTKSDK